MPTRALVRSAAALLLAAAGAAGLAHTAGSAVASRPAPLAPPSTPVIAVINIETVFSGLTEQTDRSSALEAKGKDFQAKLDRLVEEIKAEEKKAEVMQTGTPELTRQLRLIFEKTYRADNEKTIAQGIIDAERADNIREMYLKIDDAAARLARQNGYSMVLVSDEAVEIPRRRDDLERTIALKKMLFVDPTLDVTQELVTLMNNEYAAGGGKPTPPPAAATTP